MKCFNLIYIIVFISVFPFFGDLAYANEVEMKFIKVGLVDVNDIDSTIQVDLVNSDPKKNFFRENYYNGLSKAYLRKEIAIKLSKAQKILKTRHPGYSLLILDATRPRSVSRLMYEKMKGTKFENMSQIRTRVQCITMELPLIYLLSMKMVKNWIWGFPRSGRAHLKYIGNLQK